MSLLHSIKQRWHAACADFSRLLISWCAYLDRSSASLASSASNSSGLNSVKEANLLTSVSSTFNSLSPWKMFWQASHSMLRWQAWNRVTKVSTVVVEWVGAFTTLLGPSGYGTTPHLKRNDNCTIRDVMRRAQIITHLNLQLDFVLNGFFSLFPVHSYFISRLAFPVLSITLGPA